MFNKVNRRLRMSIASLFTIALLCLTAVSGFAAENLNNQNTTEQPTISTTDQIQAVLNDFIAKDTSLRNWKLLDQKIIQVSADQTNNNVSIIFDISREHILNYAKPEDSPALKGRLNYLQQNGEQLSAKALAQANKDIEMWKHDINEYITTPQNAFERIKVTATLDASGIVQPETVKFFRDDPIGNFIPISINEIPSNTSVEQNAFDAIKGKVSLSQVEEMAVSPLAIVNYDRIAARDYVRRYTSNTSLNCSSTSTTKQDKSKYNSSYTAYTCNDCANYVSQGLKAGGILTDGTWYKDSSAWINVGSLTNYMVGKQYWIADTMNNCVAGFPFSLKAYQHVMMMSYNDGTTRKYCAHTSDRLDTIWSGGSSDATYYRINY